MNKHKQMLEKAQCAVEKNRELVRQYAKKRQWYHFHTTIIKKVASILAEL